MSITERTCTFHEEIPAIAVCTECGGDICGECHGMDPQGLAVCRECRGEFRPPGIPWEMESPGPTAIGFGKTLVGALRAPRSFFMQMEPTNNWGPAAVFGVLCVTLGSLFSTIWQKAFSPEYSDLIVRYTEEFGTSAVMAEFAIFAMIPFGAVLLYFLHTALFFFALRMFGVEEATWSLVARIAGYSLSAYLLLLFPPLGEFSLGHFLMVIWLFNLEVSAVRWFFQIGFWKSMGVVLLPFTLFLFAVA